MITTLLVYKEKIKEIFSKYDNYIIPLTKFLLIFVSLMLLNSAVGFQDMLSSPLTALLVAVVCAFLPTNLIVLIMALDLLAQFFAVSMELTVITAVMMLILFLLYFRFSPKDGMILILMPLAFALKVPYLVPLLAGVILTPASAVSVGFGVFIYYTISFVQANSAGFSTAGFSAANTDVLANATNYASGILKNQEMFVVILIYAFMIFIVWFIKRLSVRYAGQIAIIAAVVFELVAFILVELILKPGLSLTGVIIQTVICTALALLIQFLLLPLDYNRTEEVQFEDDDYYYYVKAVPKYAVTSPKVSVKHINAKKAKSGRNEK